MSIETLKNITQIGNFDVVVMDELRDKYPEKFNAAGGMDYKWFEKEIRPKNFIYVRHDVNSVAFTIQKGPVKETGINGCQIDTVIETAKIMLEGLDKNFPCDDNALAIMALDEALAFLARRKRDREKRGVEGTSAK